MPPIFASGSGVARNLRLSQVLSSDGALTILVSFQPSLDLFPGTIGGKGVNESESHGHQGPDLMAFYSATFGAQTPRRRVHRLLGRDGNRKPIHSVGNRKCVRR